MPSASRFRYFLAATPTRSSRWRKAGASRRAAPCGVGYGVGYPREWLLDGRFIAGAVVFLTGAAVNVTSDYRLAGLRRQQQGQYVIPRGGAFRFLSSPNLTGEIVEWIGFALMAWSLPGLAFAMWTAANLIPRALWRHRWYRRTFPDYPPSRRAVIPGVL